MNPYAQLDGYIGSQLSHGVAAAYIRHSLLQAGWPAITVDSMINQELAHKAFVLPLAVGFYEYAEHDSQPQPTTRPARLQMVRTSYLKSFGRFMATNALATVLVFSPLGFLALGLMILLLTTDVPTFNTLSSLSIVCAMTWVGFASVRLRMAGIIAVAHPEVSITQALALSYHRKK